MASILNIKNVKKKEDSKLSKKRRRKKHMTKKVTCFLKCKARYPISSNKKILSPVEKLQEVIGVKYTKFGHKLANWP